MKLTILLIISLAAVGCSGQLVCEWQTENEQFEELIEKVIKEVQRNAE